MNRDLTELLAPFDPAPTGPLSPGEHMHRDQLLASVLAEDPAPDSRGDQRVAAAPRRRHRPLIAVAACATVLVLATGAAGAWLLGRSLAGGSGGPLAAAAVAGWTTVPTPLGSSDAQAAAATRWCMNHLTGAPGNTASPVVTNLDARGAVVSMVITRGDDITLCMADQDGGGFAEVFDPPATVPARGVTLDTAGGHGNGKAAFQYVGGSAGAGVAAVTITEDGYTAQATLDHGRWTAWWPGTSVGRMDGSVTVTRTDGTTTVVPTASLFSTEAPTHPASPTPMR